MAHVYPYPEEAVVPSYPDGDGVSVQGSQWRQREAADGGPPHLRDGAPQPGDPIIVVVILL